MSSTDSVGDAAGRNVARGRPHYVVLHAEVDSDDPDKRVRYVIEVQRALHEEHQRTQFRRDLPPKLEAIGAKAIFDDRTPLRFTLWGRLRIAQGQFLTDEPELSLGLSLALELAILHANTGT